MFTLLSVLCVLSLAVSLYNTWVISNIAVVLYDNNLIKELDKEDGE